MNNKAHLRPKDYDSNGDIKPDDLPSCNSCKYNGEWSGIGNCMQCHGFDKYTRRGKS